MSSKWLRIAPAAAVASLAFVFALVEVDNPDIWWHIKCGEMLLTRGIVPRTEIFSYTAQGAPWVDGYLLAEALLYAAYRIGDVAGVVLLGAILVMASYCLALAMSRYGASRTGERLRGEKGANRQGYQLRIGYAAALATMIPAIYLAYGTMVVRPALLTPIFALATLWLLEDHRLNAGRRIFWLIPLSALWANCHPAFFLGPMFTAIYIAGTLLDKLRRAHHEAKNVHAGALRRKRLAAVLAGQVIATLINPYGYRIYYSILSLMSNPKTQESINEWKPMFAEPPLSKGIVLCFIVLGLVWLFCLSWARFKARPEHILLFLFFAVSAVNERRNLLLFGVFAPLLISWTLSGAAARPPGARLPQILLRYMKLAAWSGAALIMIVSSFFIWLAATNRLIFYTNTLRSTGLGVQGAMFPESAVELLASEHIEGNLFNTYIHGGYIIFKLYPQYRVFIDGRYYPYPYEIFKLVYDAMSSPSVFETVRLRYDIRAVLLSLYYPNTWPILNGLMHSPNWAVVQADGSGVLFLLRGAGNDDLIRRHEINLLENPPPLFTPPPGRPFSWWNKAEYPYGPMRWGRFYEHIGRPDLAARSVEPALNYRQEIKNLRSWLGRLLIEAGDMGKGLGYVQEDLANDPKNLSALWAMTTYHILKGEYRASADVLREMERIDPKNGLETYRQALEMMKSRGAPVEEMRSIQDRIDALGWEKR